MLKLTAKQAKQLTGKPANPSSRRVEARKDKAGVFLHWWRLLAPDMPLPKAEYRFHPVRLWRFDWAFPDKRIAIEVDGGQYAARGGRHNTDADREKTNTAASMGWLVFRFSPQALEANPADCVNLVRRAVER